MPSRPFLAPRVWTRPRCAIYNDNYRYSSSLINTGLDGVERKYHESMARTEFKSQNRANELLLDANLPLTHSTSAVTLPPLGEPSPLRRSYSVRLPRSPPRSISAEPLAVEQGLLRRRSTRRRQESVTFNDTAASAVEAQSQLIYLDRCRELTNELERLNSSLMDAETRIKHESTQVKNKLTSEVQNLQFSLDEQTRTSDELRSALKRQARQIQELQANYESVQRNYDLAIEELQHIQKKALAICNEVDVMRSSLDRV